MCPWDELLFQTYWILEYILGSRRCAVQVLGGGVEDQMCERGLYPAITEGEGSPSQWHQSIRVCPDTS